MNIVIVWLLTLVVSMFGAFVGQVLCTQPWAIWTVGGPNWAGRNNPFYRPKILDKET